MNQCLLTHTHTARRDCAVCVQSDSGPKRSHRNGTGTTACNAYGAGVQKCSVKKVGTEKRAQTDTHSSIMYSRTDHSVGRMAGWLADEPAERHVSLLFTPCLRIMDYNPAEVHTAQKVCLPTYLCLSVRVVGSYNSTTEGPTEGQAVQPANERKT